MPRPLSLIFVTILTLVIATYFLSAKELYQTSSCSLQRGPCTISFPKEQITLTLELSPLPLTPGRDVLYTVATTGQSYEEFSLRLIGHDMEMPEEQYFTLPTKGEAFFEATRLFPSCTERVMIWRLHLQGKGDKYLVRINFDLKVKR